MARATNQSSDAKLEPFLEDASQQAPEPVKRRLKRNPKSLKKYTKIEKKADGFKKEKMKKTLSALSPL